MKQMAEKKRKILLEILKIGEKTNLPTLGDELEKSGVNTSSTHIKNSVVEFGGKNLVETTDIEYDTKVFRRVEPKYDEDTFKKLCKLFLKSPDRTEFLKSDYAQKILDNEFLKNQIEEFKDYLVDNDLLEVDVLKMIDPFLNNTNIFRKFPIGLYYLMFPSELEEELSIFKEMQEESDEHFDKLAKRIGEEITPEKLEKFVDRLEKHQMKMIEKMRKNIEILREEMGEENGNNNSE